MSMLHVCISVISVLSLAIAVYQYGLKKRVINEGVGYTNLLYASEYNRYVGISEQALYLLEEDLSTVLYESPTEYTVSWLGSCYLYHLLFILYM